MSDATDASIPVPPEASPAAKSGYYDTDFDWIKNDRARTVVAAVYPTAYKVYAWMDWMGGKIAGVLGLTQSRFQYAIDEHDRIERRKRRKEEQRQTRANEEAAYYRDRMETYVPSMATQKVEPQQYQV